MHKIINGKGYNTETAKCLAEWDNGVGAFDFSHYTEALYIKRTGEYFLHGKGGGLSKYGEWCGNSGGSGEAITPLTLAEAKEWAERRLSGDEYEELFSAVEDTADKTEQQRQISLLLPEAMLDSLKAKKESTRRNVSELIIMALKEAGY